MGLPTLAIFFAVTLVGTMFEVGARASVSTSWSKISAGLSRFGRNITVRANTLTNLLESEQGDAADKIASSLETLSHSIDGMTSSNMLTLALANMDALSVVTGLIPFYGPMINAAFGIVGLVFGIMGGEQDSGLIARNEIESVLDKYSESQLQG